MLYGCTAALRLLMVLPLMVYTGALCEGYPEIQDETQVQHLVAGW
jgi:hypothetical protein